MAEDVHRLGRNGKSRPRFWNLIEQPGIDRTRLGHSVRAFVVHERFAKKFAHSAVDFPRPEVAIIEKNLELRAGFLVVIRQRDRDRSRRRSFRFR
jgi:hypothetical protein